MMSKRQGQFSIYTTKTVSAVSLCCPALPSLFLFFFPHFSPFFLFFLRMRILWSHLEFELIARLPCQDGRVISIEHPCHCISTTCQVEKKTFKTCLDFFVYKECQLGALGFPEKGGEISHTTKPGGLYVCMYIHTWGRMGE